MFSERDSKSFAPLELEVGARRPLLGDGFFKEGARVAREFGAAPKMIARILDSFSPRTLGEGNGILCRTV